MGNTYYSGFQSLILEAFRFWFPSDVIIENYRPNWLNGMEIDLYLPKYRVGFEIQGKQHYLFVPYWQSSVSQYHEQRRRDGAKRKLARNHGDTILVIREFDGLYKKLRNFFPKRTFNFLPFPLQTKIKKYRKNIANSSQSWVYFKVKRDNTIIPCNRASKQYLREHPELQKS